MQIPVDALADICLLAILFACLFQGTRTARREARGRVMGVHRLFLTPTLASLAALACSFYPVAEPRNLNFWTLTFAIGLGVGAIRGSFVSLQVDRQWKLIRLWRSRDGFNAMRLLVGAAGLDLLANLTESADSPWRPLLAGLAAACAGFLVGRVAVVWSRARVESHLELRPVRFEADEPRTEARAVAWAGKTAGMTVPRLPDYASPHADEEAASGTMANDLQIALDPPAPEMSAPTLSPKSLQSVRRDARGRFVPTSKRPREVTALEPSLAQGLTDEIA